MRPTGLAPLVSAWSAHDAIDEVDDHRLVVVTWIVGGGVGAELQRPGVDQPAQYRVADLGMLSQLADRPLPALE